MVDPERLAVGLYDRGLLKFSNFEWTLKSGRKSPIYYNQRPVMSIDPTLEMFAASQRQVSAGVVDAYVDFVYKDGSDHIYGIPQAMTHVAGAVALQAGRSSLWGRVGKKDYGKHEGIEGNYRKGDLVTQLDDVVTDAGSKLESGAALRAAGLVTKQFVVMFDREEGGIQALRHHPDTPYHIEAILGLSMAVDALRQNDRIGAQEIGWVQQYHEGLQAEGVVSSFKVN